MSSDYNEMPLGNLLDFLNGKEVEFDEAGDFPVYGSNGVIGLSKKNNYEDAIILGRVGAYCGSVARCRGKFWSSDNTIVVYPKDGYDKEFAYYLLLNTPLNQFAGGAAQPLITHKILKPIQVTVPDLPGQKKIAGILLPYDDLIANNRRRITLLEEAARQLYQEWFVRLRFPGYENTMIVDGVPKGWECGTVADYYDTSSGGTPSRKVPDYYDGDVPWVKTQELLNGFIIDTDEKITDGALKKSSAKLFPKLTVLVALYGATIGELGILGLDAATNQACCALLPKDRRSHFIHAYLFLENNRNRLINLAAGAAQNNISQQIVRAFPMVMPSEEVIHKFVSSLEPTFELLLNLQKQNRKLSDARDLLLPRLMSGEITV